MKIYIYLDESGNIHANSPTNYFAIGGYMTYGEDNEDLKIKHTYKRINFKHKKSRKMELSKELKTRDMNIDEKLEILRKIQPMKNFYGCAIIFDKSQMRKKISTCNMFFNFGVKTLFKDVILQLLPDNTHYDFILSIDNRNISVGDLKDLEKYLNTEYCYQDYSFSVKYFDSKTNYGIQLADYIVNTMYMRSKNRKTVESLLIEMDINKFRLGIFPGRKTKGRISKIKINETELTTI